MKGQYYMNNRKRILKTMLKELQGVKSNINGVDNMLDVIEDKTIDIGIEVEGIHNTTIQELENELVVINKKLDMCLRYWNVIFKN
jgi:hypothetical protein